MYKLILQLKVGNFEQRNVRTGADNPPGEPGPVLMGQWALVIVYA